MLVCETVERGVAPLMIVRSLVECSGERRGSRVRYSGERCSSCAPIPRRPSGRQLLQLRLLLL